MDFNGFDFSEMFRGAQAEAEARPAAPDQRRRRRRRRILQRHLQPVLPSRRRRAEPESAGKRRGPRVRHSTSISGRPSAAPRRRSKSPATTVRDLSRHRTATRPDRWPARSATAPATCHADGGQHEVQSHLPALRRQRHAARTPARPATAMAASPIPRSSKCAFRPARRTDRGCAFPAKAMPARMGAPPGDLYITTNVEEHPFFRREGDNIQIEGSDHRRRSRPGRQDRSADHRRQDAAEDSAGHAERPEVPAARTAACSTRARTQRGDQIVQVVIKAPEVQDERTKELLRELAKLHPEDPRAGHLEADGVTNGVRNRKQRT